MDEFVKFPVTYYPQNDKCHVFSQKKNVIPDICLCGTYFKCTPIYVLTCVYLCVTLSFLFLTYETCNLTDDSHPLMQKKKSTPMALKMSI